MRIARRSLGEYPDQVCFDPSRPAILPYWINDLTESACEANLVLYGNTTGNTAQPGQTTTVTNPDGTTSIVSAAAPSTIANAQAACASSSGTWNATLNVCQTGFLSQYGLVIGLSAAALLVLTLALKK